MLNAGELTEGHQNLNDKCFSCHKPFWGIPSENCIACHKISEIGKDTSNEIGVAAGKEKILFHQYLSNQECSSCHTDHLGVKPVNSISIFDHELLSETVISNCNSCHNIPPDNVHQQFSPSCNSCHNTKGWKSNVVFNHDMILGNAKKDCSSCHKRPDDSYHHLFKDNCDKCHTTNKWVPSSFDHSVFFQFDKNHKSECKTCHTDINFSSYTCYGCHEHTEGKMIQEHREEGINDISKCADCHKSGNEDDIRMKGNSNGKLNQNDKENKDNKIKEKNREKEKEDERDDDED
jgi:hypothetical protein